MLMGEQKLRQFHGKIEKNGPKTEAKTNLFHRKRKQIIMKFLQAEVVMTVTLNTPEVDDEKPELLDGRIVHQDPKRGFYRYQNISKMIYYFT